MLSRSVLSVGIVNRALTISAANSYHRVAAPTGLHTFQTSPSQFRIHYLSTKSVQGYPDVKDFLVSWGNAVIDTDYTRILSHYAEDSVLVPTLSNRKRESENEKLEYFYGFAPNVKNINWNWGSASWQEYNGVITVSGDYRFFMTDNTSNSAQFVYNVVDRKIVTHMSRLLPSIDT